jgi:hypothetical protein
MVYVRHLSSEGDGGAWWDFDVVEKTVIVSMPRASFRVPVCSPERPRFGAYSIARVDETTWRIAPARYTSRAPDGALATELARVHESTGVEFLQLLDAPDDVAAHVAKL